MNKSRGGRGRKKGGSLGGLIRRPEMNTTRDEESVEVKKGVGGKRRRGAHFFDHFDESLQKKSDFFLD